VPTLGESYPGLSLVTWNGLVYLDGTPPETIQKISKAVQRGSQDPDT
jgi:tripartite-type tricarboxylate transporter receptor subunit TctC